MLDRIEVDVIDMALHIAFVTNLMFPEAALPDWRFALTLSRWG